MATRQLGDITIDRIIELEAPLATPLEVFDEAVPEAVAPHRHWLEPKALDPASGKMIMPVQSYLVRTRHLTILIDTCIGCCKSADWVPEWTDRRDETWLENPAAAGLWTHDTAKAIRMADRVEAGTVYINNYFNAATQSPVGGFKQSGYGRENGFEGMGCFMQTMSVWLATNPHQPEPFA